MIFKLEVPASAFEIKASYHERPDKGLVKVILEFIHQFGTPHLWYGHTHTPPTKGARVTFLGKYSLPKSHHHRSRWAPCPCCSPRSPKYFHQGLIAWFPDEGVIRCVGDQCYKKMDPEGYELAMDQLNTEIKEEKTANFLLSLLPRIPEYVTPIAHNLPIVKAIDTLRNALIDTLSNKLAIELWPHVRLGMLQAAIVQTSTEENDEGEENVKRYIVGFKDYALLPGYLALKPGHSTYYSRLDMVRQNLESIYYGDETSARIAAMSETDKARLVKILSFSHAKSLKLIAEAEDVRRFFSKLATSTLNNWALQEGSSVRVYFAADDKGFHVGREAKSHFVLPWPQDFWNTLRKPEPLSTALAA